LRAIAGPLEGRVLKSQRGTSTSWEDWSRDHPDTLVLEAR
jgi:hypothetical protein